MGSLFETAPAKKPETKTPHLRGDRVSSIDAAEASRRKALEDTEKLRKASNARTPSRESRHRGLWQLVEYPGNMSPGEFADMPIDPSELYSPVHVAIASVVEKPADN